MNNQLVSTGHGCFIHSEKNHVEKQEKYSNLQTVMVCEMSPPKNKKSAINVPQQIPNKVHTFNILKNKDI